MCLGFRVRDQGLGFRDRGLGFRVYVVHPSGLKKVNCMALDPELKPKHRGMGMM